MKLTETFLRRVEDALTFDPRQQRRTLLDRTAVAVADASMLRRRIAQALGEGSDAAQLAIDRLMNGTDQLNVSYLERGMIAADAVARVEVRNGESDVVGCATGFMVSPHLLITNHHVLPTADDAAQSWVHFRHEFDALGRPVESCTFALDAESFFWTDIELDATVVAVAPETPDRRQQVARFGWLRLSSSSDLALPGEWLTMIHHPGGAWKQVALRQNMLVDRGPCEVWYATETAAASSGAPVFNDSWQVVAIHRAGVPARDPAGAILTIDGEPWTEAVDESRIVWRAGVGTRTNALLERLEQTHAQHPLIAELLAESSADAADAIVVPLGSGVEPGRPRDPAPVETGPVPASAAEETLAHPRSNGHGAHPALSSDDAVTVTVPLRITVRAGNGSGRRPAVGVDLS
jgi:endonuclease G